MKLGPRPKDFYGYEDWSGGDPEEDERRIKEAQAAWDEAVSKLPWWQRWFYL